MTDRRSPQPPLRARLASGYLTVLQRHARRDPEGVRVVHEYVDFLRRELRQAQQALAERDDPTLADGAPLERPAAWAARAAAAKAEQEQRARVQTWLPRSTPRDDSEDPTPRAFR